MQWREDREIFLNGTDLSRRPDLKIGYKMIISFILVISIILGIIIFRPYGWEQVYTSSSGNLGELNTVMDDEGVLHAVWLSDERYDNYGRLHHTTFKDGKQLFPERQIDLKEYVYVENFPLLVDSQGNLHSLTQSGYFFWEKDSQEWILVNETGYKGHFTMDSNDNIIKMHSNWDDLIMYRINEIGAHENATVILTAQQYKRLDILSFLLDEEDICHVILSIKDQRITYQWITYYKISKEGAIISSSTITSGRYGYYPMKHAFALGPDGGLRAVIEDELFIYNSEGELVRKTQFELTEENIYPSNLELESMIVASDERIYLSWVVKQFLANSEGLHITVFDSEGNVEGAKVTFLGQIEGNGPSSSFQLDENGDLHFIFINSQYYDNSKMNYWTTKTISRFTYYVIYGLIVSFTMIVTCLYFKNRIKRDPLLTDFTGEKEDMFELGGLVYRNPSFSLTYPQLITIICGLISIMIGILYVSSAAPVMGEGLLAFIIFLFVFGVGLFLIYISFSIRTDIGRLYENGIEIRKSELHCRLTGRSKFIKYEDINDDASLLWTTSEKRLDIDTKDGHSYHISQPGLIMIYRYLKEVIGDSDTEDDSNTTPDEISISSENKAMFDNYFYNLVAKFSTFNTYIIALAIYLLLSTGLIYYATLSMAIDPFIYYEFLVIYLGFSMMMGVIFPIMIIKKRDDVLFQMDSAIIENKETYISKDDFKLYKKRLVDSNLPFSVVLLPIDDVKSMANNDGRSRLLLTVILVCLILSLPILPSPIAGHLAGAEYDIQSGYRGDMEYIIVKDTEEIIDRELVWEDDNPHKVHYYIISSGTLILRNVTFLNENTDLTYIDLITVDNGGRLFIENSRVHTKWELIEGLGGEVRIVNSSFMSQRYLDVLIDVDGGELNVENCSFKRGPDSYEDNIALKVSNAQIEIMGNKFEDMYMECSEIDGVISYNYFNSEYGRAVSIEGNGDVNISYNQFIGRGIIVKDSGDIIIHDNYFNNVRYIPIDIEYSNSAIIINNIFNGTISKPAINVQGTHVEIRENYISSLWIDEGIFADIPSGVFQNNTILNATIGLEIIANSSLIIIGNNITNSETGMVITSSPNWNASLAHSNNEFHDIDYYTVFHRTPIALNIMDPLGHNISQDIKLIEPFIGENGRERTYDLDREGSKIHYNLFIESTDSGGNYSDMSKIENYTIYKNGYGIWKGELHPVDEILQIQLLNISDINIYSYFYFNYIDNETFLIKGSVGTKGVDGQNCEVYFLKDGIYQDNTNIEEVSTRSSTQFSFLWKAELPGTFNFSFIVDPNENIYDIDRTNNQIHGNVIVLSGGGPYNTLSNESYNTLIFLNGSWDCDNIAGPNPYTLVYILNNASVNLTGEMYQTYLHLYGNLVIQNSTLNTVDIFGEGCNISISDSTILSGPYYYSTK
jgi:hypothetical protein